jgi:hypothetical protein
MLLYLDRIPLSARPEFENKVREVSSYLGIPPEWLMQLMYTESRVSPYAKNIQNGKIIAVGLIQFTSKTAQGLGTSHNALLQMSAIQQLEYVRKYFKNYKGKIKSYEDLYEINFFPLMMGKPDNWVLQAPGMSAALIAAQNKGIDFNKDSKITAGEFRKWIVSTIPAKNRELVLGLGPNIAGAFAIIILTTFLTLFI